MDDTESHFDAIVIGGGSAGLAFAKTAARHGATVAMIEHGSLGGTCVNRGCVPKKLMWQAANWLRQGRQMAEVGLTPVPTVHFATLHRRITDKIEAIRDSHTDTLESTGVTLVRETATIHARDRIVAGGKTYSAEKLVIATGARPATLDIEGSDLTQTSDDLLGWAALPDRIAILGGGYIGCEFAAILSAFGTNVTVIEPGDRLLSPFDSDLGQVALGSLERAGVTVIFGATPTAVRSSDGALVIETDKAGKVTADKVLNATGRTPNIDALGPLCGDLGVADSGALAVDDRLMTNVDGVHAIGDAADRLPLTPVATRDGTDLAEMLFGENCTLVDLNRIARAAFLIPPVAEVGEPQGVADHGTALSDGVTGPEGSNMTLTKIATSNGRTSGLALAGAHADELTSLAAALIGADSDMLLRAEGIHPTFAEEVTGR